MAYINGKQIPFIFNQTNAEFVFVLNWSSGLDAQGVQHPTDEEKQIIVDTLTQIKTMQVGTYEILLNVNGRYLPYITYDNSYTLVFRDDADIDIPMRYEIYAPSVELYKQVASSYTEEENYDANGLLPASMRLTAKYIDEQITNVVGDIESALAALIGGVML